MKLHEENDYYESLAERLDYTTQRVNDADWRRRSLHDEISQKAGSHLANVSSVQSMKVEGLKKRE